MGFDCTKIVNSSLSYLLYKFLYYCNSPKYIISQLYQQYNRKNHIISPNYTNYNWLEYIFEIKWSKTKTRRIYDGFFLYDIYELYIHFNTHLTLANTQMSVNPCILTRTSVRYMLAITISDYLPVQANGSLSHKLLLVFIVTFCRSVFSK